MLIPSLSILLLTFGILALLAIADWYVSGFSVEPRPQLRPGVDRMADSDRDSAESTGHFKQVA